MLQEWGNTENILEQPQLDPHMEYKNMPGTKKIYHEPLQFMICPKCNQDHLQIVKNR